jgi:hypothetical protein
VQVSFENVPALPFKGVYRMNWPREPSRRSEPNAAFRIKTIARNYIMNLGKLPLESGCFVLYYRNTIPSNGGGFLALAGSARSTHALDMNSSTSSQGWRS